MRTSTIVVLMLALTGLVVSDYTLVADTTSTPVNCTNSANLQCGSCATIAGKIYMDQAASKAKIEMFCKSCNNSKTPDSSAETYEGTYSTSSSQSSSYVLNIGKKCFAAMKVISFAAILGALFFQTA